MNGLELKEIIEICGFVFGCGAVYMKLNITCNKVDKIELALNGGNGSGAGLNTRVALIEDKCPLCPNTAK